MRSLTIAAVLLPAALLASAAPAQRPGESYRAAGTEPFWSVTIEKGIMRYETPEGRPVIVKAPIPRPSFNGLRYETRTMTVDVTRSRCSDGMSDRTYPDSVIVTIGQRTVRGCGGTPIADAGGEAGRATVLDGNWRVRSIDGKRLQGNPATVEFRGGRMNGSTGCNRFGGGFRFDHGRLTAGPLVTTKRACPGPTMQQEARLLGLFGQRLSASTNRNGRLVLAARNGQTIVLERAGR